MKEQNQIEVQFDRLLLGFKFGIFLKIEKKMKVSKKNVKKMVVSHD